MASYATIGVILGATYGLLAVSLIFVFQTTRVLNFAFGAFGMVGAFVFDTLQQSMNPWLALLLCAVLAAVAGAAVGAATLPVQSVDPNAKAMSTLALLSAMVGLVVIFWGTQPRATPTLSDTLAFRLAHVGVTWQSVLVVAVDVVATATIVLFFRFGRIGAALRAVSDDAEVAKLVGLPIRALWLIAWSASTVLAVVVMILLLPDVGLDETSMTFIVMAPVVAVVIARFRSVAAGFGTAFAIGLAQSIFGGYPSLTPYQQVLPLGVFIAGLLLTARRSSGYERV
jgi:branched-subunit amino acid ABC-type transport system permease component